MKRLFATDFDGTLMCDGISERSRSAIGRFRAGGGVFGVVTGREVQISMSIFNDVELDFISCCNGAMLLLPDGRREVYGRYDEATAMRLWELACSLGSSMFGPQAAGEAMLWLDIDSEDAEGALTAQNAERLALFLERNGGLCQCNMLFGSNEIAENAVRMIASELGDKVNPMRNGRSVDIPPCGIDKAFGVRRAAEYFGVAADMLYAAGNEMNDFSMVSAFHGYVMNSSPPALIAAAEAVIDDVADALDTIDGHTAPAP